jgi:leucyl aminopeptidase
MKSTLTRFSGDRLQGELIFLPVDSGWKRSAEVVALDRQLGKKLIAESKRRGFHGKPDEEIVFRTHLAEGAVTIVLFGAAAELDTIACNRIGERAARLAGEAMAAKVAFVLADRSTPDVVAGLREAVELSRYCFTALRSKPPKQNPLELVFCTSGGPTPALRAAVAEGAAIATAICLARDLNNWPAADLPPLRLAKRAAELARGDLRVRIHRRRQLEKLGMGAILGVARGSRNEPCLIEMIHEPKAAAAPHIALVGKGITFDSGGLSLKPPQAMESMKRDMAGGGVVIAAMQAVEALRLPLRIRAYIPAAENMPDGDAVRPGDVLRASNGTTIEVLNTDAEGRLVLADALAYAAARRPKAMLDFATLTGAVRIALGNRYAAIMGNDPDLLAECLAAAAERGEGLWELPLIDAYRRDLDSTVADLKNTGAGYAGTIIGGLFLREFVGETPWAHIDFSSTVMSDGYPAHPAGPSGYGVRTAVRFLQNRARRSQSLSQ